ncbi:hypothetical protein MTYM_02375 [Methylococcales bacterium]|nr:hypothetical protein MTYM_02375 [Methylococcales bacterium]
MIQRQQLLQDLQRLLPKIEQDILSHCQAQTELDEHLKQEYASAQKAQRTAEHFIDWRAAQITQSSVAWILTCVFIRFLEDNALLVEPIIAGPAGNRTSWRYCTCCYKATFNRAYRALDNYTAARLRRWLRNKYKVRKRAGGGYPLPYLYQTLGLIRLSRLGCDEPWANA